MSGIIGAEPALVGEAYRDGAGHLYNPMCVQPVVVLAAGGDSLTTIQRRCLDAGVIASAYVEEMFATGHDAANREAFSHFTPDTANLVGLAFRAPKKLADKLSKGARLHA
jgi:hypothetical protein